MTEIAETRRAGGSAKLRIVRLAFVLAVLATPVLLFFAASALVNRTRIPAEMEQFPPELAALLAPATTGGTLGVAPGSPTPPVDDAPLDALRPDSDAPQEFAFPVAHRTHADTASTTGSMGSTPTYDAFLEAELRDRPDLEGARIYLEICHRFAMEYGREDLNGLGHEEGFRRWRPGHSLPSGCAQWLIAQADFIGQFLRLGESTGLPVRTREVYAHDPGWPPPPSANQQIPMSVANLLVLPWGQKILAAEGQRRLETGDAAGAERHWRAAMRLSANVGDEPIIICQLVGRDSLSNAVLPMAYWVGSGGAPRETLTAWRATLEQLHRRMFPLGLASEETVIQYPVQRQILIGALNGPSWREPLFGWDAGEYPWVENTTYCVMVAGQDLPRLDLLTATALAAMRCKRAAPGIMREFDRVCGEAILRGRMTWPDLVAAGPVAEPHDEQIAKSLNTFSYGPDIGLLPARFLRSETQLNLLRAAIEWRLAPPDAKPDPAAMTIEDRESPWRDPFAEAPLRMTALVPGGDGSGGVLLYSLGPDLQDQQGQIEYDPTNGTVSAGDLTLEVKHF